MDYLNVKQLYNEMTKYCNYVSLMTKSSGQIMELNTPNDLVIYSHQYRGVLRDEQIKQYIFQFLRDLFKQRDDFIYCSVIKFKEHTDHYISLNIRCRTVLDYICNKKQVFHFNLVINEDGTNNFLNINSIDE